MLFALGEHLMHGFKGSEQDGVDESSGAVQCSARIASTRSSRRREVCRELENGWNFDCWGGIARGLRRADGSASADWGGCQAERTSSGRNAQAGKGRGRRNGSEEVATASAGPRECRDGAGKEPEVRRLQLNWARGFHSATIALWRLLI